MKFLALLAFTFLPASPAFAQATDAPAATPSTTPAVVPHGHKPPNIANSSPPIGPTTQPLSRGGKIEELSLKTIASGKAQAASTGLIFDGDSITFLWRTKNRGLPIWEERYAKYKAFDYGISGDQTQNLLWRLSKDQAVGAHPKLIVLLIGTNNMRSTSTPAEIAAGVQAILTEYQARCPEAVILLQGIFPRSHDANDPFRAKIKATNEELAKMADGKRIVFLDFGAKFLEPDGTLSAEVMPDFLHPSPKGYQIWADAIQPMIDKYMAAKP